MASAYEAYTNRIASNKISIRSYIHNVPSLDPALLGFKSFYAFRNRYCTFDEVYIARGEAIMVPDGFTNLDELEQKLKAFSLRLTKDECLDIPEKVYQKREIELSGEQKRVYQRLKSKL